MTLLWIDGFDAQDWANLYSGSATPNTTTRFGVGRSIASGGNVSVTRGITPSTDVYVGFAYRQVTALASTFLDLLGDASATQHISVAVTATGNIQVLRGATVVATSAANVLPAAQWNYVEAHGRVSDTTGIIEVRVNGDPTIVVTFSGDTKNNGTANLIDGVLLRMVGGSNTFFDDFYITDGISTGGAVSGFQGDVRVQTLYPSGAGTTTGLTPSAGTNWSNVNEQPPTATAYNGSAVVGTRDTYAMDDLLAGTTAVVGLRATTYWHKSDAGAASMKQALRIGGTVYYNASTALPTSMGPGHAILETNPATSAAFTPAAVSALEFGAEVA